MNYTVGDILTTPDGRTTLEIMQVITPNAQYEVWFKENSAYYGHREEISHDFLVKHEYHKEEGRGITPRTLYFDSQEEMSDYLVRFRVQNCTIQKTGVGSFETGYRISKNGTILLYLSL